MAKEDQVKSELTNILPEFVDESGNFSFPSLPSEQATTSSEGVTQNVSKAPGIEVRWSDAVPAAVGAGAGALANKLFPAQTPDLKMAKLQARDEFLRNEQRRIAGDIEATRAPYLAEKSALTEAATAAQMEAKRTEQLLQHVTKRAVELGVDPRTILSSPELFERAMSPQRGYGTSNWVSQEIKNLNPLVERGINIKSEAIPAYKAHAATAPTAQSVVGSTYMQPSGLYTPLTPSAEAGTASKTLENVEKSYLKALAEEKAANEAVGALTEPSTKPHQRMESRVENEIFKNELKLREQMAALAQRPGLLERIGEMLTGPKISAAGGALGAFDVMSALRELNKTDPDKLKVLLDMMGGVGGIAMASPLPQAKVLGAALSIPPLAYSIGPSLYQAGSDLYKKFSGNK